jgi:hypothetical protein
MLQVGQQKRRETLLHDVETAVVLTQPLVQRVPVAVSPEVKRQGREASAKLKNGAAIPGVVFF